jgi:NAD+ kinase
MERVGVLVHPTRPVRDALEVLRRWTQDRSLRLVQIPTGEQPSVAPPGEVTACDLIAALGGDGTVLKALHAAGRTRTPVLGVAYGSLGVLTTVPENELRAGLDRFAAGEWLARHLPALEIGADEGQLAWAINDLVLARRGSTQVVVDIFVDQELYVRLAGGPTGISTRSDSHRPQVLPAPSVHPDLAPASALAADRRILCDGGWTTRRRQRHLPGPNRGDRAGR